MSRYRHIAITGIGRSGTTFFAHCLYRAGWEFGDDVSPQSIGEGRRPDGGGMEHPDFVRCNRTIGAFSPDVRARYLSEQLAGMQVPAVVKDPRFVKTLPDWWVAGYRPELVLVCIREWATLSASWQRSHPQSVAAVLENLLPAFNDFVCWLVSESIPHRFVVFPHVRDEPAHSRTAFAGLIADPVSVIESVWRNHHA